MENRQLFDKVFITIIFSYLGYFFGTLMYPRLNIALADLPFILRIFVDFFVLFFMLLGMVCFIWGIVVLLQRTRPQFYEFLVAKIFGPKQLIFIGSIILAIPLSFAVLLLFGILFTFLEINLHISVPLTRELDMYIFSTLSSFFKSGVDFMYFVIFNLVTGIYLIVKGNEQLQAREQNQYSSPQVMYPPINQQR